MSDARIRPAAIDDVPTMRAILAEHGNDGPILYGDIVGPYLTHLVVHHRTLVSVAGDQAVAFAAVVDAGVSLHLADLFVRRDLLGRGIGRPLLDAVFGDAIRRTTFASDDPRALPLYVRAGMSPLWASLYLEGRADVLPEAGGVETADSDPAELARIELAWTGIDRSVDHAYWSSLPAADTFVVVERGEVVAIAHARARQTTPVRWIDHLLVRPDADPVAATMAALRRAGRDGNVLAAIQGPSPALRPLLELGFQVTDRDQFMASEPGLVDPARLVPNSGML